MKLKMLKNHIIEIRCLYGRDDSFREKLEPVVQTINLNQEGNQTPTDVHLLSSCLFFELNISEFVNAGLSMGVVKSTGK